VQTSLSLITLFNKYFESITEWLPEALGLYRIIFDVAYMAARQFDALSSIIYSCYGLMHQVKLNSSFVSWFVI